MSLGVGLCFTCTRMRTGEFGPPTCAAFPDGIPVDIFEGGFDHTQPYEGDRNIRYLPAKGTDVAVELRAAADWRATVTTTGRV